MIEQMPAMITHVRTGESAMRKTAKAADRPKTAPSASRSSCRIQEGAPKRVPPVVTRQRLPPNRQTSRPPGRCLPPDPPRGIQMTATATTRPSQPPSPCSGAHAHASTRARANTALRLTSVVAEHQPSFGQAARRRASSSSSQAIALVRAMMGRKFASPPTGARCCEGERQCLHSATRPAHAQVEAVGPPPAPSAWRWPGRRQLSQLRARRRSAPCSRKRRYGHNSRWPEL